MYKDIPGKDSVTISGRRNWERLLALASRDRSDAHSRKIMADALAALVAEVTPLHREVLASQYVTAGARGRIHTHPLPPGLVDQDRDVTARWAALVLLDCVDHAADVLARDHSLDERQSWRAAAEQYTRGAERYGRNG